MSNIDKRLKVAVDLYSRLIDSDDISVKVGRAVEDVAKERGIFEDILKKLEIQPGQTVLSVGVGCG